MFYRFGKNITSLFLLLYKKKHQFMSFNKLMEIFLSSEKAFIYYL